MYKAKDGRNFGNTEMGRHYDRTRPAAADGSEHHDSEEGKDKIEDVVEEHGPATHITMHSHHEDGHVHKATHHDHESAKEHVSKAFGEGEESEGERAAEHDHEEPDGDEAEIPGFNG